jgi:thiol-disulfide isomerase/thioredoxin
MKTSVGTVTAAIIVAVLGAGAGFGAWQYLQNADQPKSLYVDLTPAKPPTPARELIGSEAPPFSLPDLAGQQRSLIEWRGQVVVINFWATWCAPCREEMPMLVEVGNLYRDQGVEIIGIAVDDRDKIGEFVSEFGVNFPVVYGDVEALALSKSYGNRIGALPFTAIIDRAGRIGTLHAGILKKAMLTRELRSLL